jgi:predicted extracellular nuclease
MKLAAGSLRVLLGLALGVVLLVGTVPATANTSGTALVISQVYGGGGNTNATYQNDYVELFNPTGASISVAGWSVQYTSATGTGTFGSATNLITPLSGTVDAGHYLLVQEASNAAVGAVLPTPDVTDSTPINMAAGAGKVALVNTTTPLGCNGSSTACGATALASIVDLVGYGTGSSGANFFEGSGPAPTISATASDLRANGGCTDTDSNAADFNAGAPSPRNAASATHFCNSPTGVGSASPASLSSGGSSLLTVTVTPGTNPPSTGLAVTCDLTAIGGAASQALFDNGTNGDATSGDNVFSFATTVTGAPGTKSLPCTVSDAQTRSSAASIALTVEGPLLAIHDIQGASHVSPHAGEVVSTNGIVTARSTNGFWIQDQNPDADDATSEGVFVFTSSAPTAFVGDAVHVNARVQEFRPGSSANGNLTTTELSSPTVTLLSTGNPLPPPVVVGTGGRIPPDTIIEDDAAGNVETSGVFDPATDGLDFWESLEGMRIQVNNAVAVGPTATGFGETQIVGDNGAHASLRTARGGLLAEPNDFNPERVVLDDLLTPTPVMNVGDHYAGPIVGVLDYNFGNFFLEATQVPTAIHDGVTPESTTAPAANELAVATFNVENLAPSDPQSKFDRLAALIVHNLEAPDVISVEEVQDNSGATDNGVVAADQTLTKLVAAISAAGGPSYQWREIDPVNDADGGQPGGNIRQVFLFRSDRGLSFVDRPGGDSTTAVGVTGSGASTQLTFSPGRIDPTSSAWTASRKPLAGEFLFRGHHLFVIANHFNSKGGDDPLEGRFQPPVQVTAAQRHQQAQTVHDFVAQILAADPTANIVVDGDLNDFEFSDTVSILKAGVLHDLIDTLPLNERYSYVFEGNSQTLDHVLTSDSLFARTFQFDVVHVNAEFADQASDHDPSVVRLALDAAPTVSANGPYDVNEGGSVAVSASGNDSEGAVTYAWDLDNNGTFETAGQNATFDASAIDGPATRTIKVQATDTAGQTAVDSAVVTIHNVAPSATFNAPPTVFAGSSFTISLTAPSDPSGADTTAGFTYAFDCGSGYGAFGPTASATCSTSSSGTLVVHGKIRDKDRDAREYTAQVQVTNTADSLCALTRTLVTKPGLAQALCDKLAGGEFRGYRNQLDAQTGKTISAADAALLKSLSLELG